FALQNNVDAIVINLANSRGIEIIRREMILQVEGAVAPEGIDAGFASPLTISEGADARISQPNQQPPKQLIESLRESMARQPLISAAYLANVLWGQGQAHYIVGMALSHMPGDDMIRVIIEDVAKDVHPLLTSE